MLTEKQIDAAAAAAAEKANGGKFIDPLFYKPEHKAFWREVVRAALEAADAARADGAAAASSFSDKDVENFSDHCVYIRSIWLFATRIWRDSDEQERRAWQQIAPSIFADLDQVLAEYVILAASRITDSAIDARKNQNFTVEMFVNGLSSAPETHKPLDALHRRMLKLRKKIQPARDKLVAHADRETIRSGKALGGASWEEWDDFWSALADFVRLLNEKTSGEPFEIDAGGVKADAENLLKALEESRHFKTLMDSTNPVVRDACLNLALPKN
jgi:hypothetical protein